MVDSLSAEFTEFAKQRPLDESVLVLGGASA
jgi:hypothetical protein